MSPPNPRRGSAAITAAYWAFMLSEGALRVLVMLHLYTLGYSPMQLAGLFLLYEVAGILTNLATGWLAARFGPAATLYSGFLLQIAALTTLAQLDAAGGMPTSLAIVMVAQAMSGVAMAMTRMSSKSAGRLLATGSDSALFRWTALLTGSKNVVKGLGFFIGAALLALVGLQSAAWGIAALLGALLIAVVLLMPEGLPKRMQSAESWSAWWPKDPRVIRLSLARVFLFMSRDVWFVLAVPLYFQTILSNGTDLGRREAVFLVGGFMALWVMAYGLVQGLAPRLLGPRGQTLAETTRKAAHWAGLLVPVPLALAMAALIAGGPVPWLTATLVIGLFLFGFVFAVNASVHSYLALAFGSSERITRDVGFYYMANATGKLIGTFLSGISYQWGGLALSLALSCLMATSSWLLVRRL